MRKSRFTEAQIGETNGPPTSEASPKRGRVLVLGGGGAKGAYEFGCLKAFRKHEICFDAVAGTSVGALNAIIWSTGQFDLGEALWKRLNFSTTFTYALLNPQRYPLSVLRAVAYVFVALRLLWATYEGYPIPGGRPVVLIATALATLPWVLGAIWTRTDPSNFCLFAAGALFTGFGLWRSLISHRFSRYEWLAYASLFPLIGVVTLPQIVFFFTEVTPQLRSHLGEPSSIVLSYILVMGTLVMELVLSIRLILMLMPWLDRTTSPFRDATVLGSSQLAALIQEILSAPLRIRTVVTMARRVDVFDPDNPRWWHDDPDMPGAKKYPDATTTWTPIYQDLSEVDKETAVRCCLASAALPFGIVQPVEVLSHTLVDGGVADNTPVFPFMNDKDIREIYVVLVERIRRARDTAIAIGATPETWAKRDRDIRIVDFAIPRSYPIFSDPPYQIRERPPKWFSVRQLEHMPSVKIFSPSSSLGGVLSGTLNFDGQYAQQLIERGYQDTLSTLECTP
ncbi:MAG TPA: patatin-like phospholipase family protein [Gemmatimonadaceae bacterium]